MTERQPWLVLLATILVFALCGLVWVMLYGERGWFDRKQVEYRIQQVDDENEELYAQIVEQQGRLEALENNDAALEEQVRAQLGLVAENETLLILGAPPPGEDENP